MKITHMRVDDRYVHGQVTAAWMKIANANVIWVVNDSVAKNPMIKSLQISLAPPGSKVEVYTIDEAIEKIKNEQGKNDGIRVLVLVANPVDALKLIEAGAEVDKLNMGQMSYRKGRTKIEKTLALAPEDIEAVKKIMEKGIWVYYQQLPDFPSKPVDFQKILKDKGLL
ncbi:MAG: PTS system mannose/fructose/N-acetylgalactosamine-transporter subunit IIB [Candidatus Njordarchaeia archaeon]